MASFMHTQLFLQSVIYVPPRPSSVGPKLWPMLTIHEAYKPLLATHISKACDFRISYYSSPKHLPVIKKKGGGNDWKISVTVLFREYCLPPQSALGMTQNWVFSKEVLTPDFVPVIHCCSQTVHGGYLWMKCTSHHSS